MNYHLQQDVALVSVCGTHFLVAAGAARGKVPSLEGITAPGAYFWHLLEQRLPTEEIIRQAAQDYQVPVETAEAAFQKFAGSLQQKGYLTIDEVAS